VMPRSILNADQHQNLIARKYSAKFKLTGYWDLRHVRPLFNVPSCVLFAEQSLRPGNIKDVLPVLEWKGALSGRDLPWAKAKTQLTEEPAKGRVIWLGNRCALSTGPGSKVPTKPSKYAEVFRQGATTVPRNLFFVTVDDCPSPPLLDKTYWAATDERQALEAKKPYKEVRISGSVEGSFIFSTALSRHLVPFQLLAPVHIVLPLEIRNGHLDMLTGKQLNSKGYRDFGKWMEKAETIWKEKRGEKKRYSLAEWLDYSGKLTAQSLNHRHLLLYNHSGMNVAATYFDRKTAPAPFIVDVKLYWAAFSDAREAHYLVAILNSDAVNEAIKPFQSMGLLGERDIHKKVLDLPLPVFDEANVRHSEMADLGIRAYKQAKAIISDGSFPVDGSLASQRGYMRTALGEIHDEMEAVVATILGLKA
jgi:hypothetical protein